MTVKMIKLELKKAFTTPWFYLSLAVLMLCALMSTVYSIDSYQNIRSTNIMPPGTATRNGLAPNW